MVFSSTVPTYTGLVLPEVQEFAGRRYKYLRGQWVAGLMWPLTRTPHHLRGEGLNESPARLHYYTVLSNRSTPTPYGGWRSPPPLGEGGLSSGVTLCTITPQGERVHRRGASGE